MKSGWRTLRELDESAGTPKGTAFRAFKRIEPTLREPLDYRLLRSGEAASQIAELRGSDRIYDSSRNVVLLSPALSDRLLESLRVENTG